MHKNKIYISCLISFLFAIGTAQGQAMEELKKWLSVENGGRPSFSSQAYINSGLSKKDAAEASALLLEDVQKQSRLSLQQSWANKALVHNNDTLKFEYKIFGEKPSEGRSLFISMHGGGNAPPRVNDQQWKNQIGLYKPAEGVYVAPRAPTNTWNLWHEQHIDSLFDDLIHAAVLFESINPNKVYIMGYSAGGDGVYQLAPRMADRWAAAAMMAGHPNETTPESLRNIGFTIHMGALDSAYNRNKIAKHWGEMLDSLQQADPGGYKHFVQLHEGRAHWMNREDTVAIDWMMKFTRNPIPNKIVWKQDDVHQQSFYWLAVPSASIKTGGEIVASYSGNEIVVEKNYSDTVLIRLNDAMMNLDKPVTVKYNGQTIYKGKVKRTLSTIYRTGQDRKDSGLVFCSQLKVVNGKVTAD